MFNTAITLTISILYAFGLSGVGALISPQKHQNSPPLHIPRSSCNFCYGFVTVGMLFFYLTATSLAHPTLFTSLGILLCGIGTITIFLCARRVIQTPNIQISRIEVIGLLIITLGTLLLAATPPTFKDELVYHLTTPKDILSHGGFFLETHNIYSYFPMLQEMHTLFFESIENPILPKLLHTVCFITLITTLYALIRTKKNNLSAIALTLFFATTPSILHTATLAYVDITYTVFLIVALQLTYEWAAHKSRYTLISLGILCGGLLGLKYLAYQPLILINLALLLYQKEMPPRAVVKNMLLFNSVVLIIGAPWFLKNILLTKNPLFPFCYTFFNTASSLSWDSERAAQYMTIIASYGLPTLPFLNDSLSLRDYLLVPIRLCFSAAFDDHARFDGIMGPVWFTTLLTPLLQKKSHPQAAFYLRSAAVLFLFWILGSKQIRFIIPTLACVTVASGLILHRCSPRVQKTAAAACLIGIISNCILITHSHVFSAQWRYITNTAARNEYLTHQLSSHTVHTYINQNTPPDSVIFLVGTDNLNYYLERPYISDYIFTTHTLQNTLQSHTLLSYIHKNCITHIVLKDRFIWDQKLGIPAKLRARLSAFLKTNTRKIITAKGYSLYELTDQV